MQASRLPANIKTLGISTKIMILAKHKQLISLHISKSRKYKTSDDAKMYNYKNDGTCNWVWYQ